MVKWLLPVLFVFPGILNAQNAGPWEAGFALSISNYEGDLHTSQFRASVTDLQPAVSLFMRRKQNDHLALRLNLLAGRLQGSDKSFSTPDWRPVRGVSFTSPLLEGALMAEIFPGGLYKNNRNTSSLHKPASHERSVAPYILLGVGAAFTNPHVNWNDASGNEMIDPELAALDKKAQLRRVNFVMPLGAGLRFTTSQQYTFHIEGAFRPTFSDYIDGFSLAGDPHTNDWYFTLGAGISMAFGHAPKVRTVHIPREKPGDKSDIADRDNDGIADEHDDCPDYPGLRATRGCPDRDRDGVADGVDLCPDEPGYAKSKGCPDSDGDGVADGEDACPDIAGPAASKGCPPADRDRDGIADEKDVCPDMPGQARWNGCPDSDGDGIPDDKDDCPGIKGPTALNGCPDSDSDGVADKNDECPTVAGVKAKNGCPDAPPPAAGVPFKVLYFDSTLPEWQKPSATTLDEALEILKNDPDLKARIEGHTDNTGDEPANDLLSERRAKKCRDYLVAHGIAASRLNFVGFGADRPAFSNDTLEGRKLNRRVEIHFIR